jgi:hypothetical protein
MTQTATQIGCCEQLARFFPDLNPARVPVRVTAMRHGNSQIQEATTVQFASHEIVIFPSSLPLEFDDRVQLAKEGNSRRDEGVVVALQYHEGNKAVAVKFAADTRDWMTKP